CLVCLLLATGCAVKPGSGDIATIITDFGANTPAGYGGRVIKVTNLEASGEGSLAWALAQPGPRIVVFEVGGVIDLGGGTIAIDHPFVTLSGQRAPCPGITLIRGGLLIRTHDVRIEHLRVRPGTDDRAPRSGWDTDGIGITRGQARNIHINHCS